MASAIVAVLLLFGIRCGSCAISQRKWHRDLDFDEKTISQTSGYDLGSQEHMVIKSVSQCASACMSQRPWCKSFFYQRVTKACSLHALTFKQPMDSDTAANMTYYKFEDVWCPQWEGYTWDSFSSLCYKVHQTIVSSTDARNLCSAEGADLINLDTVQKVQTIAQLLVTTPEYAGYWFHVAASRPASEWNTPWTSSSHFFQWERTGQPMVAANQPASYFWPGEPNQGTTINCMDMKIDNYINFTHFYAFADGYCAYNCYFICDIAV